MLYPKPSVSDIMSVAETKNETEKHERDEPT